MVKSKYEVPIYKGKITFVFFSEDEIEIIKNKYNIDEISNYDAVTLMDEWTILFHIERITPGIIAHESKHLLNRIFKYYGIRLDVDNDEAECYLLTWIVDRVHKSVRKFNLTIK
jgi:hypothetical protein